MLRYEVKYEEVEPWDPMGGMLKESLLPEIGLARQTGCIIRDLTFDGQVTLQSFTYYVRESDQRPLIQFYRLYVEGEPITLTNYSKLIYPSKSKAMELLTPFVREMMP